MTNNAIPRAAALAALLALSVAPASAAGPFQVRRAADPKMVGTAPPLATIATSPFDGDLAAMADGSSYFYGVYDAGGVPMAISVVNNRATHTLRIAFDDSNPNSAPVNASASSVAVAPASIHADGLQTATIDIVPTDANGVLLGTGLSLSIDAAMLWPAQLTGPIADLGDGSYRATAVSSTPGSGTVRVVVEGVALASQPVITATPLDPSASLRDLAMAQLQGLIGAGGPMSGLAASAGPGSQQARLLAEAQARAAAALATLANGNETRDDNVLKTDLDAMLRLLAQVAAAPGALSPMDVRDMMDDVLGVARLIAEWHIDEATGACGVCSASGYPRKVCDAITALAEGDAMRAAVDPDWGATVDAYARAVERAIQAQHGC